MPAEDQIILRPSVRPMRSRKIKWWQDRQFTSRKVAPPEIPQLAVVIHRDDGTTKILPKVARAQSGMVQADVGMDIERC